MLRIRDENINTAGFWDEVWEKEPDWYPGFGYTLDRYKALTEDLKPWDSVLDVGGGRGEFLAWIGPDHRRMLCDQSRWAVESALKSGWADNGVVHNFPPLTYWDDGFDAVFCCEVLEHVEEPQVLVDELRRVCRPNGLIGVSTPLENTVDDRQHVWSFGTDDIKAFFHWTDPKITICSGPTIVATAKP